MHDDHEQIVVRRNKLRALRDRGAAPYPNDFRSDHTAAEVHAGFGSTPDADLATLISYLASRGVAGERTYVCRMDTQPDDGLHRELASTGALLGYGGSAFVGDGARGAVAALEQRLEDGQAGAVAIGLELEHPGAWDADLAPQGDGAGPAALFESVERRLRELGASDNDVDGLLGKNLLARAARSEAPRGSG